MMADLPRIKLVQVQLLSMCAQSTRGRTMWADSIVNYDYCSYELLCFWMHAESPIATAWYFHYSFLFGTANNEMKTGWDKTRRKKVIGISKQNISENDAQKDTKKLFAPRWNDGARTKLYFKYIIRKYMMLIKI